MKNSVLNDSLGSPHVFGYPRLSADEERLLLANLFEQLLLFDKISLTASRVNFTLTFLIYKLGINNVERLIDSGYIEFILWSPIIVTGTGRQREDKTIDESVIYGQSPIVAGSLSEEDLDPERNIKMALRHFPGIHSDRKRIFTRKALKHYSVPDGMLLATDSAKLVIDAYKNNNLHSIGLPFVKEPDQLDLSERGKLLDLSNKVTQTAVLAEYGLKSYENYEAYEICKTNFENIGKAYNIAANTSNLFKLENLPDLKQLYISENLDFDSVFKLRHLPVAKSYRKWINAVGENSNMQEVSREYISAIKGDTKFFEKNKGKFIKHLSLFGINAAVGAALAAPVNIIADFTIGLLETFWIDGVLKGKNPSMFIERIREEITPEDKLASD